jgi:hypothetical protein
VAWTDVVSSATGSATCPGAAISVAGTPTDVGMVPAGLGAGFGPRFAFATPGFPVFCDTAVPLFL